MLHMIHLYELLAKCDKTFKNGLHSCCKTVKARPRCCSAETDTDRRIKNKIRDRTKSLLSAIALKLSPWPPSSHMFFYYLPLRPLFLSHDTLLSLLPFVEAFFRKCRVRDICVSLLFSSPREEFCICTVYATFCECVG